MPIQEVTSLRKAGKYKEAYDLAQKELREKAKSIINLDVPFDSPVGAFFKAKGEEEAWRKSELLIWEKRALSWALYSLLKSDINKENKVAFINHLDEIRDLDLPGDEDLLYEKLCWQVGSMIFLLSNNPEQNKDQIEKIYRIISSFSFKKPDEGYSFLFKSFQKALKDSPHYIEFADWWNFENFRSEDYLEEEFNDKKIISIAEQAYIAYARHLLETYKPSEGQISRKEKIEAFIPRLDQLINSHPEHQYPPYFLAKLLLETGNEENSLSAIIPFAQKKQNEFWVWDVIAGAFPDKPDTRISCYCRALLCSAQDKYLIKLRQTFAGLLINKKMYQEAKTEIENIIRVRNENNWDIPEQIRNWIKQPWYQDIKAFCNNLEFYQNHAPNANELIYSNIPEKTVAVEFVNRNRKILNFIDGDKNQGFFKYDHFKNKVNVGDLLVVRLKSIGNDGLFRALTIKKSENTEFEGVLKMFTGEIHIPAGKDFGFVDDVFIPPISIKTIQLINGQKVQGRAVISFNKLKGEWGWKGIVIVKVQLL